MNINMETKGDSKKCIDFRNANTTIGSSSLVKKISVDSLIGQQQSNGQYISKNEQLCKQVDYSSSQEGIGAEDKDDAANIEASQVTFPQRLMEILSNEEHADTISWLPHGKGFIIYRKRKFAEEILPKYFRKCKFTSFTRKLKRWHFNRITRGPEAGAYYHDMFRRDNEHLCSKMTLQTQQHGQMMVPSAMATQIHMNAAMSRLQLAQPTRAIQMVNPVPLTVPIQVPSQVQSPNDASADLEKQILALEKQLEQQKQAIREQEQQLQKQLQQNVPRHDQTQSQDGSYQQSDQYQLPPQQQEQQEQQQQQQQQQTHFVGPGKMRNRNDQAQEIILQQFCPLSDAPGPTTSSGATPRSTPNSGQSNLNSSYSKSLIDAAINALERTDETAALTMRLAQEKIETLQRQPNDVNHSAMDIGVVSVTELQRQQENILRTQQHHLDEFTRQRMFQAALEAAKEHQQEKATIPLDPYETESRSRAKAA